MEAWYALYTKPHAEKRVERALVLRGFTAFLPLFSPRGDGRVQPFFPSYLFVHCDLAKIGISSLQWTPGLSHVLSFDGAPAVVPDNAIDLIRAELSKIEAEGGLPAHLFRPGDEVYIDGGPLDGLRGIFQGPVGPAERVRILLHFLGQVNRTEVPVSMLRPASDADSRIWRRRGTRGRGRQIQYKSPL